MPKTSDKKDKKEVFNPQFSVEKKDFNVNRLSARSCMCYPCKC